MNLLLYLLIILKNLERTSADTCSNILMFESYEGLQTLEAIYNYITSLGCLLCSKPTCDFSLRICAKWSDLPQIPLYNNIFEFGLAGNHFPLEVKAKITINNECYLLIKVDAQRSKGTVVVTVYECLISELDCTTQSAQIYRKSLRMIFEHKNCFYFGLIFLEEEKVHYAESLNCKLYASRNFKDSNTFSYKKDSCHFNKDSDSLSHKIILRQDERRKYDGVPVILPCSPGGFIVDPRTGRFAIGEPCLNSFDGQAPNTGIYFIIDKVYDSNESLFFPFEKGTTSEDFTPLYITKERKVYNTTQMSPKHRKNELMGNVTVPKIRSECRYYPYTKDSSGKISFIGVTPEPPHTSPSKNGTVVFNGRTYYSCSSLLSPENFKGTNPLNKFVPHTACFVCAEPDTECDYSIDPRCPKWASLKSIPIYNKYFEFGILAMHLPLISVARVNVNKYCYVKVEIKSKPGNSKPGNRKPGNSKLVNVTISECFIEDLFCYQRNSTKEISLSADNYHCVYIGLAFFNNSRIYTALNFDCKAFASSKFNANQFLDMKHEACLFKKVRNNLTVQYSFLQEENRTHNGVPFILPCSPGGFAVDPSTGKFVINDTCWKLFWNSVPNSGINFIVNKIFGGKENLLFPIEVKNNRTFPSPMYLKINGKPLSREAMAPSTVSNKIYRNKVRKSCIFVRGNKTDAELDNEDSQKGKKTRTSTTRAISNGSSNIDASSSAESSTLNYNIILLDMLIIYFA